MISAGRRRHLVRFFRRVESQDSDGAVVVSWEPAYGGRQFFADVDDVSGRELLAAAAVNAKTTTRIITQFLPRLEASMRVEHAGRYYNIDAIIMDLDSRRGDATLNCSVGTNEG